MALGNTVMGGGGQVGSGSRARVAGRGRAAADGQEQARRAGSGDPGTRGPGEGPLRRGCPREGEIGARRWGRPHRGAGRGRKGGTGLHLTRRARAAQPEERSAGRSEGFQEALHPESRRLPASRSPSPHLGIRGERGSTAGRPGCSQPLSLTWRPTSCHRARSGLPPLGWRRHLCLPAPPPSARPSRPGRPRPRSIERERLERTRGGRTTIECTA